MNGSDNQKRCHVLLVYRSMIPSVRLCGHCQMEELARKGKIDYRACQEMRLTTADLNWADVILLGRLTGWYEHQLAKRAKKAGKFLVYIIDDDLLNIPVQIGSALYYAQPQIRKNILSMIEMSDAVLSPSPLLLGKYAADGRLGWLVEEPAVSCIGYQEHSGDLPVKIGFAGSVDRTGDIEEILEGALRRIKDEYGDKVQFEFFGAIPSFANKIDAQVIPYCNSYEEYRKTMNESGWDIGLAPMPATPFHACKHYNKFIEYAAAGCLTIHSAEEPYIRLRPLDCSVFVENDRGSWYEALKKAIDDRAYREDMRRRACDIARTRMSCSVIADELYSTMEPHLTVERRSRKVAACMPALKICDFFVRARIKLQLIKAKKRTS